MEEDFIREMGYVALANRLKRLSDVMMASGRKMYKAMELDIEPSWYLVFKLLQKHGSLTVTEIAQKLGYSHPSVVSLVSKMGKKEYVSLRKDKQDGRKQRVALSSRAEEELPYFESIWQAGERAMRDLFDDGDAFFATLNQLDEQFQEKSFQERVLDEMARERSYVIRAANPADREPVWEIFRRVIADGDTYVFDPSTPKQDLEKHWFANYMQTFVLEREQQVVGTYILKPNYIDAGRHIANASFMVHPDFQGQGIGHALCEHSIDEAHRMGFSAMQFNIVVSTNKAAIALWEKHGFSIIGTTPGGFHHQQLGLVDTHIMYRKL